MSRIRTPVIVLVVLAGLVVVLAAALYGASRLAWFERQASSQLSEILGWPVQVGDLAVGYFPLPWIEVDRLVVAGNPAGDARPLAEVSHLRVQLPWRTVLGRGAHVSSVTLTAPRLVLAVDADGVGNWEPFVDRLVQLGGEGPAAWSVGSLKVEEGGLEYGRAGEAPGVVLTGLAVAAGNPRPATPFDLDLRLAGQAGERTFHATAAGRAMLDPDADVYAADELVLAGWIGGADLPLAGVNWAGSVDSARVDLAAGTALLRGATIDTLGVHADAEVEVTGLDATPTIAFSLETGEFSPRMAAFGVNRPLPETTDPEALSRARLTARGTLSTAGLVVGSLQGELDDTHFDGSLRLPSGVEPLQVRLQLDVLDLDRYLPPDDPAAPTTPQSALQELLAGLEALDVEAEIRVGEARMSGARARGLTVTLTPAGGEATP